MGLTNKQKHYIAKHQKKESAEKIAKDLNLSVDEVKSYIQNLGVTKAPFYFYIIAVIIPVIFIILLEVSLRLFNYGYDYSQWMEVTPTTIGLNPDVGRRYFYSTKAIPESIQDVFDKEKKENSYRVFVLGGSSAAGYPFMPLGSFSRYLEQRLQLVYPDKKVEVVNISLTAVNSYTVKDFFNGIIDHDPDVVLIYAGHNEFYGALGVGSLESLGTSRMMVNLVLSLNDYKLTQFLRDIIQGTMSLFADEKQQSGTLMSRMADDQSIPLDSEKFNLGIEQFRGNISDVLELAEEKNIKIVLSTLPSNLKDQAPFISKEENNLPSAADIFKKAQTELAAGNCEEANKLFRYAKDLDMLRFRSPEKINTAIRELGEQFNIPVVDADSYLNEQSDCGIIGNNLMTDHLHPTLRGYQLIGKLFYETLYSANLLPSKSQDSSDFKFQDSLTVADYHFSEMDSSIAEYKLILLKNDWPFIDRNSKKLPSQLIKPESLADSIAFEYVMDKIEWIDAHRKIADIYFQRGDLDHYLEHMEILIVQYPIVLEFYNITANRLIEQERYQEAMQILKKRYDIKPDAFTTKWIGTINLYNGNNHEAVKYLEESSSINSSDAQVYYNLAGAFARLNEFEIALQNVNKALEIEPDYPSAHALKSQLEVIVKGTH
ncbi:MAG: tetratricopeptide repeat protein [Melioribacteraceae bacterium]|nr:tetratricopeptide repeat protein [Melioribacteraceae bacterium]MCF8356596.1 tetratricopeptide repeat protein [Melioribacteraceae bacterium]MCF8395184.1 tetratricopeptide repeat protein [Melioribacteraceae bacterium]MCF8420028.1 tetratricopeptide repeat protein [Melioribacteraceae bacterium]